MKYYVYVLELIDKTKYIGSTPNLQNRFKEHNSGECLSTRGSLPCSVVWYACFKNKLTALRFEKYLKSGSGRAFRHKHFDC